MYLHSLVPKGPADLCRVCGVCVTVCVCGLMRKRLRWDLAVVRLRRTFRNVLCFRTAGALLFVSVMQVVSLPAAGCVTACPVCLLFFPFLFAFDAKVPSMSMAKLAKDCNSCAFSSLPRFESQSNALGNPPRPLLLFCLRRVR